MLSKPAFGGCVCLQTWLSQLAEEMKSTLAELLRDCLRDSRAARGGGLDPNKFPSQILCLSESITFTERCEEALKTNSLTSLVLDMKNQLEAYTSVDIQGAPVLELKLKALIMDTIHNIEVVEMLVDSRIPGAGDWKWQKQLRCVLATG